MVINLYLETCFCKIASVLWITKRIINHVSNDHVKCPKLNETEGKFNGNICLNGILCDFCELCQWLEKVKAKKKTQNDRSKNIYFVNVFGIKFILLFSTTCLYVYSI